MPRRIQVTRLPLVAAVLAVIAIAQLTASAQAPPGGSGGFWAHVREAYGLILELHRNHVDTTELTMRLDRALVLWDEGNRTAAIEQVQSVIAEAEALRSVEGQARLRVALYKYGVAAVFLSIAPLTYVLLPRVYITAWYRARRRWVVER